MELRFSDDRGAHGFSWIAVEPMTRTSHALVADGRVWLVDPLDWQPALERASELGRPAAVLQLLDRHGRDGAALAARLGVPLVVTPTELAGTPFEVIPLVRRRFWREVALWWPEQRTLVVPEALGTNRFFTIGSDLAGVHGLLKLFPPRQLRRFEPEHVLVGHGEGLHGPDARLGLQQALGRSRLTFFRWVVSLPFSGRAQRAPQA